MYYTQGIAADPVEDLLSKFTVKELEQRAEDIDECMSIEALMLSEEPLNTSFYRGPNYVY